jgi:hypothetical protein
MEIKVVPNQPICPGITETLVQCGRARDVTEQHRGGPDLQGLLKRERLLTEDFSRYRMRSEAM